MTERKVKRGKQGFTLSEMLVAVAILVVLLSLAIIPITRLQRNLRQTELDSKAETIYMAAQNRLTQLQASGRGEEFGKERATLLGDVPWDAEQGKYQKDTLYYTTSDEKQDAAAAASAILPQEQLERELWDNHWVVEYDPDSASVYAVFYSEKAMSYSFNGFNSLRSRSSRLSAGATVGYYGGDSTESEETGKLTPKVRIINKEQLVLEVTCDTPRDLLHCYVTVRDAQGHSTSRMELTGINGEWTASYRTYTGRMVLDSLADGMRFAQQKRFENLTPGSDLSIYVEVESESSKVDSARQTVTTNSLFSSVEGGNTAVVTYARHLQNLDRDSGLPGTITRVVQQQDIQFVNANEEDGWDSVYPGLTFTPIRNGNLRQYDSTAVIGGQTFHPVIYGLPVVTAGDGGLFESYQGTLRNIRLCGAQITAAGNAGGLVGSLSGATTVEGCQVYLSPSRDKLSGKTEQDVWLSGGGAAGGLVGSTGGRSLTVSGSFASTVLQGGSSAGGLVGLARSTTSITASYADSYVYATGKAGGLVGDCYGTANISLTNCYAAGFLQGGETAGLIAGSISGVWDVVDTCYTACAPLTGERLTYSTACPNPNEDDPAVNRVYYMAQADQNLPGTTFVDFEEWSGQNRAAAVEQYLGDAFTAETGGSNTVAYNLMDGMGLGAYSYPRLKGLGHYGDWKATFESGALAYYEAYADGSYGFRGANKATLKDDGTVLGDGYGMVYNTQPEQDVTLRYTLSGAEQTVTLSKDSAISMGDGYYLLPLPGELVNTTEVTGFYRQVWVDAVSYYFNPHFTATVTMGEEQPTAPAEIGVRTARQLNNLSLYYADYAPLLSGDATFQQERPIDYGAYSWAAYGRGGQAVTQQQAIGASESSAFTHAYDGGWNEIAAVPLTSAPDGDYAGLFGLNRGALRNIVLTTGEKEMSVRLSGEVRMKTAYAGALAGRNDGTIYNCAAAGYSVGSNAYQGSILYLGGLVGYNGGTIRASGVSTPSITGSSNYARLLTGGFTGGNGGTVLQSYAMANIEIQQIRGTGVVLAGFTAENTGSVRNSYCATALMSPGADGTWGFAPATGSVTACRYLSGGTYRYMEQVHLYDHKDQSGARAVSDEQLASAVSGFGSATAGHTYRHPNTQNSAGQPYAYPASVTGHGGQYVHYGDWVTRADLGTVGMVYWELEEGGSNSGYHFTYIGFEGSQRKSGSSLCLAHDDGGKITSYGYGYYWAEGNEGPSLEMWNMTHAGQNNEAAAALHQQMPQFSFVTYQTSDTGLHMVSGTKANGVWLLTLNGNTFSYAVSPFFANSYAVQSIGTGGSVELGTDDLPYQVRSVEQLQYLNWSYYQGSGRTDRDVAGTGQWDSSVWSYAYDYQYYPYLQYTASRGNAEQTKEQAIAGDRVGGSRPIRTWQQTHDLNGQDLTAPEDGKKNYSFHPIAGSVYDSGNSKNYSMVLYNWFGGKYDGQSYYIKNVNIDSYCYNVGIFGTTAGAEIQNIVLYSDNGAVIQRSTDATPSGGAQTVRQYSTSYALGGLVGIAYDYNSNMGKGNITNCAIAGYQVIDNSKNRQHLGEAAIGGLVGVSSVNLNKCSAVVDLKINCTHIDTDGYMNAALYGNYVRVGGLAGGVRYVVTDCYTGGSISVGADTLRERVVAGEDNNVFADPKSTVQVKANASAPYGPDTYVYIGGIGGSGFSASFKNFINAEGSVDGKPVFNNCYTYMDFPNMEGTITGISLMGSVADRNGRTSVTIQNCYYLNSSKENISFAKLPKYYSKTGGSSGRNSLSALLSSKSAQEAMLAGYLNYLKDFSWSGWAWNNDVNGLTGLTYEQMSRKTGASITPQNTTGRANTYDSFSQALGSSFQWVTTEENGALVHGKYSFPGNSTALLGQDYPFPAVLTQRNVVGTAYLHYGRWPQAGLYWSQGMADLDLISDYDDALGESAITLDLRFVGTAPGTQEPQLQFSREGVVQAQMTRVSDGTYQVRLVGQNVGATEITATLGSYTARLAVNVTAVLTVSADRQSVDEYVGESDTLTLTARNSKAQALSGISWDAMGESGGQIATLTVSGNHVTVTGRSEGEETLLIKASYTLGGRTYTGELRLPATIRMQGILGIAGTERQGTAETASAVYTQGTMNREGTRWDLATDPGRVTFQTGAPSCKGAALFLYSQGQAADLKDMTVTEIQVISSTGVTYSLPGGTGSDRYRVVISDAVTENGYTCRAITLRGSEQEQVTLRITLENSSHNPFVLTTPYVLTEADTQVTASFALDTFGRNVIKKPVSFGQTAQSNLPTAEELAGASGTIIGWTPDVTTKLYQDTVFMPVFKTTEDKTDTGQE